MPVQPRRLPGIDLPRTLDPQGLEDPLRIAETVRRNLDAIDQNMREVLRRFEEFIVSDEELAELIEQLNTAVAAAEAALAALGAALAASGLGVAPHGANADFPRPAGFLRVAWIGSAFPNNRQSGDLVFRTP